MGPDGGPEIVNYRAYRNVLIVDRLFAAAELRLGDDRQQRCGLIAPMASPAVTVNSAAIPVVGAAVTPALGTR